MVIVGYIWKVAVNLVILFIVAWHWKSFTTGTRP
jgi:hypothetical protein